MIKIIYAKNIMNLLINIAKIVKKIYVFYAKIYIKLMKDHDIINFKNILLDKDKILKTFGELNTKQI